MSSFDDESSRIGTVRVSDEAKRCAFDLVVGTIDRAASFPGKIFLGKWGVFLFFEADRLFAPEFAAVAAGLLNAERAEVCCLLNFSETDQMAYESAATLFIDAATKPHAYDAMLRRDRSGQGWLYGMDRYGCTSNRGGWSIYCEKGNDVARWIVRPRSALLWSIYCEKGNDVAAIALRQSDDKGKYLEYLKQLHAEPISVLLRVRPKSFIADCTAS